MLNGIESNRALQLLDQPNQQGASKAAAKSASIEDDATAQGLEAVSGEFESVFYSMMLKTMRNSLTEGGLFGGEKSDSMGGMFDLFMSQHLAKAQPLGIGKYMELSDQDAKTANQPSADATANVASSATFKEIE